MEEDCHDDFAAEVASEGEDETDVKQTFPLFFCLMEKTSLR